MASMNPLMPIIFIFLLILAILWFLLPFAVFGTKDKLDTLIAEIKRNTDSVDALHETMKK